MITRTVGGFDGVTGMAGIASCNRNLITANNYTAEVTTTIY